MRIPPSLQIPATVFTLLAVMLFGFSLMFLVLAPRAGVVGQLRRCASRPSLPAATDRRPCG